MFDLIARQSDKFQRDIARPLVGWLGELATRGTDAATLASGFSCVAVRPDLYGVPQVQLESHPIVVRRDGCLRSGTILSFALDDEFAVATLRVRLTDGDVSEEPELPDLVSEELPEITIDADTDAWVWPGHEDELAPPLKGMPQSELLGSRISLLCLPSELQSSLHLSAGLTLTRSNPQSISVGVTRLTDKIAVHPGTITRFACDAECKIKWLWMAVSISSGTDEQPCRADLVEVKVHPRSALWCWEGCEAEELVAPLHGVAVNSLVGHRIFLSFRPGQVVESEIVSLHLRKAQTYSVELMHVAVTWGAARDRHGTILLSPYAAATATGIDWRWPGYEHEMAFELPTSPEGQDDAADGGEEDEDESEGEDEYPSDMFEEVE